MKTFHQIGWLVRKDVALFFRTKDTLVLIFVFSVLVVLIFSLAFGPLFPQDVEDRGNSLPVYCGQHLPLRGLSC